MIPWGIHWSLSFFISTSTRVKYVCIQWLFDICWDDVSWIKLAHVWLQIIFTYSTFSECKMNRYIELCHSFLRMTYELLNIQYAFNVNPGFVCSQCSGHICGNGLNMWWQNCLIPKQTTSLPSHSATVATLQTASGLEGRGGNMHPRTQATVYCSEQQQNSSCVIYDRWSNLHFLYYHLLKFSK